MEKESKILILLLIMLLVVNYSWLDKILVESFGEGSDRVEVYVSRVIDGDTIEINGNESVRLLGINTPENGEPGYGEAKEFLEGSILNKSVYLEYGKDKRDRYGRTLAYIFLEGNVNLEVVENGYGNYYFPSGKDIYYENFVSAWEDCLLQEKGLCKRSEDICADCIVLREWDTEKDWIIFENVCNFNCSLEGWSLKDEGRKKFAFESVGVGVGEGVKITGEDFGEDYVWTKTGDSFFLRDDENGLVLWGKY